MGDIDLKVGNIDFPGDVVIRGEIRGRVRGQGRQVDPLQPLASELHGSNAKETLSLSRESSEERRRLSSSVERSRRSSSKGVPWMPVGSVRVKTSVLNSALHTKDRLEMGERGTIIGGIVKAQNGVSAEQIGTERGPRTEIHCGVDFRSRAKARVDPGSNIALAVKLREIEAKMKSSTHSHEVLSPLCARIKAAIHQLNENARTLVSGLDRNESAEVSVRGYVYPGTYLEICHVSHFIKRPLRLLTFRLDKTNGKIVETRWEKTAAAGKKVAPPGKVTQR